MGRGHSRLREGDRARAERCQRARGIGCRPDEDRSLADAIARFKKRCASHRTIWLLSWDWQRHIDAFHNYDEARRVLELAIREHLKSAEPLAALGDFEIQQQTYDAAIGHLKASLALAPANVETRNLLAGAYSAKATSWARCRNCRKCSHETNVLAHFLRAEIYSDRNEHPARAAGRAKGCCNCSKRSERPHATREDPAEIAARRPQGRSCEALPRSGRGARAGGSSRVQRSTKDSETLLHPLARISMRGPN